VSDLDDETTEPDKDASLDWGSLLSFHVPVFLVGGCVVLPLLYYFLADAGAFGAASDRITAKGSERLLLGVLSIAPVVFGFGSALRFSIGRFIAAAVVLGFVQFTIAMRSAVLGGPILPITLGGGVLGIGLGYALGHAGLRVRAMFEGTTARRLAWGAAGVILLSIAVLEGKDQYRDVQNRKAENARLAAESAQRKADWQALFDRLDASGSSLDVASKRGSPLNQATLTWQLNDTVEFSLSLTPCIRVKFESGDDRLPYIDRFLASRSSIEDLFDQNIKVTEPKKERVYAGGGVSKRDAARLPGYWSNGGLSACLEDDDGLEHRHTWIRDNIEVFFEVLQKPLYAIANTSLQVDKINEMQQPQPESPPDPLEEMRNSVQRQLAFVRSDCLELDEVIEKYSGMQASGSETLAQWRREQAECEGKIADLTEELESLK